MRARKLGIAITSATLALLACSAALAQSTAFYYSPRPKTGSAPVLFRWYICWPDSNTTTLALASVFPMANLVHHNIGERVRVQAVDKLGRAGPMSVASAPWQPRQSTGVPELTTARLDPNFPNPFNPSTTLPFVLPAATSVRLVIYNLAGKRVRTLVDADLPAGDHHVVWDGRDERGASVPSGSYLCRMTTPQTTQTSRLTRAR